MKKSQYIDEVRNIVGKEFHYKQIEAVLDNLYRQNVHDLTRQRLDSFDFLSKEYNEVAVSKDAISNIYYTALPVEILQFTDPTEGVRSINTVQGTDLNFSPTSENKVKLLTGLNFDNINTRIGYWVRHDKIWYYKMIPSITKVRLALVIPFTAYEETDNVALPSGRDYDIIQSAINLLLRKQPEKLKQNG